MCFQLPRSLVQNLQPSKLLKSLAQLNSMVSSWETNGKATTAGFLLVFEDNVGEDGLSTQSTHKVNIDCPYYKEAIAPNPKVLNMTLHHQRNSWKNFMGEL